MTDRSLNKAIETVSYVLMNTCFKASIRESLEVSLAELVRIQTERASNPKPKGSNQ